MPGFLELIAMFIYEAVKAAELSAGEPTGGC
jgi:hypothetical protein